MARSFVFPGGTMEPEDDNHRMTAARELFEEAGVLLCRTPIAPASLAEWRRSIVDGVRLAQILEDGGVELDIGSLRYFAHWITPSIEKKRFSARFYVAELPAGQVPSFDDLETVDQVWITPGEALERVGELRLPPPQVRTMYDLRTAAACGPEAVLDLADERARNPHPILPRSIHSDSAPLGFELLLPWDPRYAEADGDGIEMPDDHPLAAGPSRFVLTDGGWRHLDSAGR